MLRFLYPLLLWCCCVTLLIYSFEYPTQARMFPWIVLFPGIAMLTVLTAREALKLFGKKLFKDTKDTIPEDQKVSKRKYILMVIWLFSFLLIMYLLGLLVGIPVFLLLYFKLNHLSWLKSIVVPLCVLGFFYGFFIYFMKLFVYPGLIAYLLFGWD